MATALAQTPIYDLCSPPLVVADEATGSARAPTPFLPPAPPRAGSRCVALDEGIAAPRRVGVAAGPHGTEHRVLPRVMTPAGDPYPGRLLDDILEYRALRAHMLAGNRLDTGAHARYVELEQLLRANDEAREGREHLRAFHRFDVQLRARVRHRVGRQTLLTPSRVENISAGGVKLIMSAPPAMGDAVWLQLKLDGGTAAVLPSRVVWASGHAVGLMFAGAPRWQ